MQHFGIIAGLADARKSRQTLLAQMLWFEKNQMKMHRSPKKMVLGGAT